ncbi:MAG: hypothetical protein ACFE96_02155 [Candidatus Hermodarchaeota archaeon]
MSKKILATSLVLIAIGGVLIPSGMLVNSSINEMVESSVDEGLLGIQEEALPLVESMIAELGIPRALRDIRKKGLSELEAIVNATFFMFLINMTLHTEPVLGVVPLTMLFDKWIHWILIIPVTYSSSLNGMGYPPIKGISEYHQQNLWYGEAKFRLIEGTESLPGLIGNNTMGTGVLEFLELCDQAACNSSLEQELTTGYNATWNQLVKLVDYYRDYFVPVAIPMIVANMPVVMPEYTGMDTMDITEMYFYEQWANCTVYEDGYDFSEILDEISDPLFGFEVGRLAPSNISRSSIDGLWDDNNSKSLTNDSGINYWIKAAENLTIKESLRAEFSLESYQIDMILNWLWNESFKWNMVPVLITLPPPLGEGMTLSEYAKVIFLEVWTNGTADGRTLYPYGFPLELKATTVYGFELGYQSQKTPVISSNISLESAKSLWNTSNEYSLVNKKGLTEWFYAVENPDSAATYGLKMANELEDDEVAMILSWLPKFRDHVMPYLAQEEMNLVMDSTSLGNTIQLSMSLTGGVLISLAGIGIARNIFLKRKLK